MEQIYAKPQTDSRNPPRHDPRSDLGELRTDQMKGGSAVTLSRLHKDGTGWKDSTTFRRDDLPVVAKVMDMAYAWIWERQTSQEPAGARAGQAHLHLWTTNAFLREAFDVIRAGDSSTSPA